MLHYYVNDQKKKSFRDPNNWAENWEMVFDAAACRSPWTPDLLMVVSVSGRGAACVQTGDEENSEEFNLSLFNQCPSPLRAALMEMPGGAKIEQVCRSLAEGRRGPGAKTAAKRGGGADGVAFPGAI